MIEPKYGYMCSVVFNHELEETPVEIYETPDAEELSCCNNGTGLAYCYVVKVKIEVVGQYGSGAV